MYTNKELLRIADAAKRPLTKGIAEAAWNAREMVRKLAYSSTDDERRELMFKAQMAIRMWDKDADPKADLWAGRGFAKETDNG